MPIVHMRSLPCHFTEDSIEHFLRVCWGSSCYYQKCLLEHQNFSQDIGSHLKAFHAPINRTHAAKQLEQNNSTSYLVVFPFIDIFLHLFSIFFSLLWKALNEAMRLFTPSNLDLHAPCSTLKDCHIISSFIVHSTVVQKWVCGNFHSRGNRNFARTWLMSSS